MAFAFGLAAEIERKLISDRTKTSLANLKSNGKRLGRPVAAKSKKLKLSRNVRRIKKLMEQGVSQSEIAKIMNVNRMTVARFINKIKALNGQT